MTDVPADEVHEIAESSASSASSRTRRQFMLGACASAAARAFAAAAGFGAPFGLSPAFAYAPPAGGGLDAFLALSQQLTGRTSFDATLGKRVYDALATADSQFTQNVAALNAWLKTHGGVPSDIVTQALQVDRPNLAKTVGAVMRAWYLGLVGDMPSVRVVAYERALMFDPVKDVLTIPSYCRDVPFYWRKKPSIA
jgi:hypothetical protein